MKKILTIILLIMTLIMPSYSATYDITNSINKDIDVEYLNRMINTILGNYKYDITREELYNGMYKGLFEALDKHSMYFTKEEFKEFSIETKGEFGGLGIVVTLEEGGYIRVVSPIEDTPAYRAGIKSKDLIVKINGEDIKEYSLEKAVSIMRGEPGTKITLGIKREDKIINIEITRAIIKVNPVEYEIKNAVGILRIKEFNNLAVDGVNKALKEFKEKNVKGIIIDLRNNPGGLLTSVLDIADNFVENDKELLYIDYKNDDKVYKSTREKIIDKPLVVLINGGSASAAEILTGIIKDYKLGTIIGENSYGKGTVQTLMGDENKGGFKFTIAEYLTPSKNKIDGIGIKPDIEIKALEPIDKEKIKTLVKFLDKRLITSVGDVSISVLAAEERLELLGYKVEVDGIYDKNSKEIIKEFQKKYNLKSDGILGKNTEIMLDSVVHDMIDNVEDNVMDKALNLIAN